MFAVACKARCHVTKEDLIYDMDPFSAEIGILLELPSGNLAKVTGLHYRNINGEGFAVMKADYSAAQKDSQP